MVISRVADPAVQAPPFIHFSSDNDINIDLNVDIDIYINVDIGIYINVDINIDLNVDVDINIGHAYKWHTLSKLFTYLQFYIDPNCTLIQIVRLSKLYNYSNC